MGRTLTNTTVNLGIQNACDEAMYQVRYPLYIIFHLVKLMINNLL